MISSAERQHLRQLAEKQLEVFHSEKNQRRVQEWMLHNACKGQRPMIHVETDTFESETITPLLQCQDPVARRLEADLLRGFYNITAFDDDWVTPDYFGVQWGTWFHPFGHKVSVETATDLNGNSIGHHFNTVIEDLEDDWDKLGAVDFGVNVKATENYADAARECFGDILPVKIIMNSLVAVPTQQVVHLMGMENMCFAMYDYPELFKKMMDRIADDYLAWFDYLTKGGFLRPTAGFELLNQGSKCFTDQLPADAVTSPPPDVGLYGFPGNGEHLPRYVPRVHLPLLPAHRRRLRPPFLRLLRAGERCLAGCAHSGKSAQGECFPLV